MFTLLLLASIICLVTVLWYLRRWRLQRKTGNIPTLPREVPFFGHLLNFAGDSIHLWDCFKLMGEQTNELGGVAKVWFGPALCFYITDPAVAKEVLNIAMSKMFLYKYVSAWLGQGLVTSNGSTWKHHRKIINPSFSQNKLNQCIIIFDTEVKNLVKSLEDNVGKGEFDVYRYFNQYAFDAISKMLSGLSNDDQMSEYIKKCGILTQQLFELMALKLQFIWMMIEPLYYWTKTKTKELQLVQNIAIVSSKIIEKQKSSLLKVQSEECLKSFLGILIENEANGSVTMRDVREELLTIISAGTDTVTSTLINTIVMLGSFPEIQEKLHYEMKKVFRESDRGVTKDDLPLLVYTDAVLKEVMRLFPAVPLIARDVVHENVQIGKYHFPRGCSVIFGILGMHTNKSWGDPQVFRPERWLGPKDPTQDAFMPFSLGKRSCIGKGYAMMMMKTVLAHLVRRYTVRSDHRQLQQRWEVTAMPASGTKISIEYRAKSRNLQLSR